MFENFESTKCQSCIIIMECYCHYKSNNIHNTPNRSSHQRCSVKKGVLRNSQNSPVPESATLLKKRLWRRCFPVNFAKFLRTTFSQNTSGRLLLSKEFLLQAIITLQQHYKFQQKYDNIVLTVPHLLREF